MHQKKQNNVTATLVNKNRTYIGKFKSQMLSFDIRASPCLLCSIWSTGQCLAGTQSQITLSGEWDVGLSEFGHTSHTRRTINKAAYCTCAFCGLGCRRRCSMFKLLLYCVQCNRAQMLCVCACMFVQNEFLLRCWILNVCGHLCNC